MKNIRFAAQEDWNLYDLQAFFHQVNIFYNRLYVINELSAIKGEGGLSSKLTRSLSRVPNSDQLLVKHIEMHSPAKFSFEGTGDVVEKVNDVYKDVSYRNELEKKSMEEERKHQQAMNRQELEQEQAKTLMKKHKAVKAGIDNALAELDVVEKMTKIMRDANFSEEVIQDNISKLLDPIEKSAEIMRKRDVKLLGD